MGGGVADLLFKLSQQYFKFILLCLNHLQFTVHPTQIEDRPHPLPIDHTHLPLLLTLDSVHLSVELNNLQ